MDFKEFKKELELKSLAEIERDDPHFFFDAKYLSDWVLLPFGYAPQTDHRLVDVANYNTVLEKYSLADAGVDYVREFGVAGFPCYTTHLIMNSEAPAEVIQDVFEMICVLSEEVLIDNNEYHRLEQIEIERTYNEILEQYELQEELNDEEKSALFGFIRDNGFEEYGDWIIDDTEALFYARYGSKVEG